MLGGLDWTQTFLGSWFRTQNQVLFFFAAIIFTVSVALHLSSIEEEQYSPQQERGGQRRRFSHVLFRYEERKSKQENDQSAMAVVENLLRATQLVKGRAEPQQ